MKYYFKLQYKRFCRRLDHLGVNPYLGIILGLLCFIALSKLLFYKTEYARWIYLFVAVSTILKLAQANRSNFIRSLFTKEHFYLVRLIENSVAMLPFLIYLLFEAEFMVSLILLLLIIFLAFVQTKQYWLRSLPTPFKRFPFEFIVGFRKTFWLIGIAYFLIFKAIQVDNFNLGLFGLGLIFLISMSYYQKPEQEYFVWIHTCEVKQFLAKKFYASQICVAILSFLPLIALILMFPTNWLITLSIYFGGCIFLGSMIVAKYSAYPSEMNIPQAIFYLLSLMFPPILIITIIVFYTQARKKLEPILE